MSGIQSNISRPAKKWGNGIPNERRRTPTERNAGARHMWGLADQDVRAARTQKNHNFCNIGETAACQEETQNKFQRPTSIIKRLKYHVWDKKIQCVVLTTELPIPKERFINFKHSSKSYPKKNNDLKPTVICFKNMSIASSFIKSWHYSSSLWNSTNHTE